MYIIYFRYKIWAIDNLKKKLFESTNAVKYLKKSGHVASCSKKKVQNANNSSSLNK